MLAGQPSTGNSNEIKELHFGQKLRKPKEKQLLQVRRIWWAVGTTGLPHQYRFHRLINPVVFNQWYIGAFRGGRQTIWNITFLV